MKPEKTVKRVRKNKHYPDAFTSGNTSKVSTAFLIRNISIDYLQSLNIEDHDVTEFLMRWCKSAADDFNLQGLRITAIEHKEF